MGRLAVLVQQGWKKSPALQFEGEGIDARLIYARRIAVNGLFGGTHFQWLPAVLVEKPQGWKASPALQFEGEGIDARLIYARRIAVNERFSGTHFQWLPAVLVEKPQGWKASPAMPGRNFLFF